MRALFYRMFSVWFALTLTFLMLRLLPGDPITSQLTEMGATPEMIEQRKRELGLDAPLWMQYVNYWGGLGKGDWGISLARGIPVMSLLEGALPHTLSLATGALIAASAAGLGLGVLAATHRWLNVSTSSIIVISLAISTPVYCTGTALVYFFSAKLNLLPSSGVGSLQHMILPVGVLGFHTAGAIARVTQTSLRQTLQSDFIRTAYAKGLPARYILLQHTIRASLPPILTVIALQAGFLFSGTVIVETLFLRPGLGRVLVDAVLRRDYTVVQAVTALSALTYTVLGLLVDLIVPLIDPRINAPDR